MKIEVCFDNGQTENVDANMADENFKKLVALFPNAVVKKVDGNGMVVWHY